VENLPPLGSPSGRTHLADSAGRFLPSWELDGEEAVRGMVLGHAQGQGPEQARQQGPELVAPLAAGCGCSQAGEEQGQRSAMIIRLDTPIKGCLGYLLAERCR